MSIPADRNAHGRPATFSGSNGTKHKDAQDRGVAAAFAGVRQGGPSPMPAEAKAGAFQCDESCQEYQGNAHDAAGPRGTPAGGHNNPHAAK